MPISKQHKKTRKVKAWIWKKFDVNDLNFTPLEAYLRFKKPVYRADFIPCTISYKLPINKK